MKLFAIRIENGDTVLSLAADRQDALKWSGLTEHACEALWKQGCPDDRAQLVASGLGPQKYEMIELDEFQIVLSLDERGDFEISDLHLKTFTDLSKLYPILHSVINRQIDQGLFKHREIHEQEIEEAISQEKTRLALPGL